MSVYTYIDVRRVLRRLGFRLRRSRKHETWQLMGENGTVIRQTQLSHKHGRDVPIGTFQKILDDMGIDEERFKEL